MSGHVWTTFYPFQWDLNWVIMLAMIGTMLRLANHGFEAFRLDSIALLWKQAGTDGRNLPQSHFIARALRAVLDIALPATPLKAEAIMRASSGLPRDANWRSSVRCHDDIGWGAVLGDLAGIDANPAARLAAVARYLEGPGAAGHAISRSSRAVRRCTAPTACLRRLRDSRRRRMMPHGRRCSGASRCSMRLRSAPAASRRLT
ncbi:hypothetical protein [Sphingomonas sp.]|uniref:hypothetical protein n=1 Tax=Sphingomonas sp. TaxID=28214 RepID=UPI00286FA9A2|nr:hypothetical protein [Sphingomonas sp.]